MTATKLWLIVVGFFALVCGYLYFVGNLRQNKIYALESEKTALKNDLLKCEQENEACENERNKEQTATAKADSAIGEIRTVIKTVKSPCACYDSRIDESIFDRVRRK